MLFLLLFKKSFFVVNFCFERIRDRQETDVRSNFQMKIYLFTIRNTFYADSSENLGDSYKLLRILVNLKADPKL